MKKWVKKLCAAILMTCMLGTVSGTAAAAEEADKKVIPFPLQQEAEEELQKEVSAFEITAKHREMAAENEAGYPVLDAGRGNPNWINTQSRYALTRFMN